MGKIAVVAIGGNSLVRDDFRQTVEDQYDAVCETAKSIAGMLEQGYEVVVTHGNGPQVGFILRRSDIAYETAGMHRVPLASCVADTQGAIGYQIQQALGNEFRRRDLEKSVVTLVTQVVVSATDPAFLQPTKPIGSFYTEELKAKIQQDHSDWVMKFDAGRGYRRVVPSPLPLEIVEVESIKKLIEAGVCLIAVGGGGIPVIKNFDGSLEGVEAVVDKDFASSLLATQIKADILVISTAVPQAYLNFGKADQKALDKVLLADLKQYVKEGHFAPGSMLPKMQAAINFLENGGEKTIITNPASLDEALAERTGTHIFR